SNAPGIRNRNIEAAHRRAPTHAGERIRQVGARLVVVKANLQAVLRSVAPTAAAPTCGSRAKAVVHPYIQIVAVADRRRDEMKILESPRQVRTRNILQQCLRDAVVRCRTGTRRSRTEPRN